MTRAVVVHPFPARMAPELAEQKVASLEPGAVVLDPMMGSGTFPLAAAASGHLAFGCDTDPLALIISQTAGGSYSLDLYREYVGDLVGRVNSTFDADIPMDEETSDFIDFWFDPAARSRLAALALEIRDAPQELSAPLWCAFSRLIIAKDSGASRARDVSHSRPHRVRDKGSFDPVDEFSRSAQSVALRVSKARALRGDGGSADTSLSLLRADARQMPLASNTVDAVMTSPPYLVAIDYLRGHRMSLVWMGYSIAALRSLRASNVGSEAGFDPPSDLAEIAVNSAGAELGGRAARVVGKYVADMDSIFSEISRVVKRGGIVSFVIANATISGTPISIEFILDELSSRHGFVGRSKSTRALPGSRRYLPPPATGVSALTKRMKEEVVLGYELA